MPFHPSFCSWSISSQADLLLQCKRTYHWPKLRKPGVCLLLKRCDGGNEEEYQPCKNALCAVSFSRHNQHKSCLLLGSFSGVSAACRREGSPTPSVLPTEVSSCLEADIPLMPVAALPSFPAQKTLPRRRPPTSSSPLRQPLCKSICSSRVPAAAM